MYYFSGTLDELQLQEPEKPGTWSIRPAESIAGLDQPIIRSQWLLDEAISSNSHTVVAVVDLSAGAGGRGLVVLKSSWVSDCFEGVGCLFDQIHLHISRSDRDLRNSVRWEFSYY